MEIRRQIGEHDLLVETSDAFGVWLSAETLAQVSVHADPSGTVALERGDILRLLCAGDSYRPLSIQWELLDRCNFSCPFCYIVGHSFRPLVRLSSIEKHLDELIAEGLLFCTLTGGEVTVHPDFVNIYLHLKKRGVVVDVFTNGFNVNPQVLDAFRAFPPASVEVSLYSLDNDRMRKVYGAKSTCAATRVLGNVLQLKALGVNVICKTFLNIITMADAAAVSSWCQEHGIEYYSSSRLTQAYDGEDLRPFEFHPIEFRRTVEAQPKQAVCLPCGTKNYGGAIDSSFSLFPCPAIRLPDCTFDIRALGVRQSIAEVKAFMRQFQDSSIRGGVGAASCMAFAKPVRSETGEIVHFTQP